MTRIVDFFDRWMPAGIVIMQTILLYALIDIFHPLVVVSWVGVILFAIVCQVQGIRNGWYEYPLVYKVMGRD